METLNCPRMLMRSVVSPHVETMMQLSKEA